MAVREKEILEGLRGIKAAVERLEKRLSGGEEASVDPITRRRELLREIYWSGNAIDRAELLPILKARGTDYQWIAQQVKKGYLSVVPLPGTGSRYSVTGRAVRELALDDEAEEAAAFTALSSESFAEDWDSEEDSVYDGV